MPKCSWLQIENIPLHFLLDLSLCCLSDGVGDVAKEVCSDLRVPDIAVSDSAAGQAEVQNHELLLEHEEHALPKGSQRHCSCTASRLHQHKQEGELSAVRPMSQSSSPAMNTPTHTHHKM